MRDYALDPNLKVVYYVCMNFGTPFLSISSIFLSSSFFRSFPRSFSASAGPFSSAIVFFFLFFLFFGV